MTRKPILRLTALLFAVAFQVATLGEALGFHPCPHHDALALGGAALGAHHAMTPADGDTGTPPSHRACTCVGQCQAGGVVGFIGGHDAPALTLAAASTTATAGTPRSEPPLRQAARLLPFATAPPIHG